MVNTRHLLEELVDDGVRVLRVRLGEPAPVEAEAAREEALRRAVLALQLHRKTDSGAAHNLSSSQTKVCTWQRKSL